MSSRPIYSPAALGRIQKAGEAQLGAFIAEIPGRTLRTAVRRLFPAPRGFRPTSDAAVEYQVKRFINAVAKRKSEDNFEGSREERALYALWKAWTQSNIPDDMLVRELFEGFDQHDDESDADKLEQVRNALSDIAKAGACAHETLARFIEYGPFDDVAALQAAIQKAPTLGDIEQKEKLRQLPQRLEDDESRLRSFEDRLGSAENDLSSVLAGLDEIRQVLLEVEKAQEQTRKATKQVTGKWAPQIEEVIKSQRAELSAATQAVADSLRSFAARLEEVSAEQQKAAGQSKQQVQQIDGLSKKLDAHSLRLDELAEAAERLSVADHVKHVGQLAPFGEQAGRLSARPDSADGLTPIRARAADVDGASPRVDSLADLVQSVKGGLITCGLKKSSASAFAEELVGAAASQQVIFFKGSLAVEVARACALAISDSFAYRLSVPVGTCDVAHLRDHLAVPRNAEGVLPSVVVEAINASPLDCLREVLLDKVVQRPGGTATEHPVIVFATLSDSLGAFPVAESFLELGPIFDLEHMRWNRRRRDGAPAGATISAATWPELCRTHADVAVDLDETIAWCRKFALRYNARFEASVLQASLALQSLRQDGETTVLQSITVGWLMPLWQMLDVGAEEIGVFIDEGKCDGVVADDRLVAALIEYRARAAGRRAGSG